jgi:hypothetical protein
MIRQVGQMTILPKSTLAGVEGVESKMLSSESKKNAYFFDYVQTVPGQPEVRNWCAAMHALPSHALVML